MSPLTNTMTFVYYYLAYLTKSNSKLIYKNKKY